MSTEDQTLKAHHSAGHCLAETLQVPRSWVMAAAKRGELPHLKFGRYTRFTAAQVEEIIASRTVTAHEELPNPWGRVTRRGR